MTSRLPTVRLATLPALLVPLALVVASCGDDDTAGEATTTPTSTTATAGTSMGPTGTDNGGSITVYSGRDEELVGPLIEDFEAATGIEVEARYGNSAEMGAALLEEGEATPADVFYSQEVGAVGVLAEAGLLAPLPGEVVSLVDARFQPADGNLWVGVTGRSRVIVYNPDLVAEPPAGVLELTEPAYEGDVAIVPGNAGFQAFVTAFRVSRGEDAARQWLLDMQANGVITDIESNDDVLAAVDAGEVPIGLINHYYWARLQAERGPDEVTAQLVFLEGDDPGALVNATAAGLTTKGADNPAALALAADGADRAGADGDVELMLRPEQIIVDPAGSIGASVAAIRYEGHDALVDLTVGRQPVLARWSAVDLPAVDDAVSLTVKGAAIIYPKV